MGKNSEGVGKHIKKLVLNQVSLFTEKSPKSALLPTSFSLPWEFLSQVTVENSVPVVREEVRIEIHESSCLVFLGLNSGS